jgi:acyl carrier protein
VAIARRGDRAGAMSTEEKLRQLIEQHVELEGPDEPLQLRSIELVMLVEAIEDAFGLRVKAAEVTPENFGTLARLVTFVDRARTA